MNRIPESLRLRIKGTGLIIVIASMIWLSIAIYNKTWADEVNIVVDAERAGLQLNENADVRMRGALVGQIKGLEIRGDHARIHLAINRDDAAHIPADLEARILPTTLFGQKYVELVSDSTAAAGHITEGHVIPIDKSSTSVELSQALDHISPVLTAVRPQDLSSTLDAIATGLEGRGTQLGENAVRSSNYLSSINEHLPLLVTDLRAFAQLTKNYAAATPDFLKILRSSTVTSGLVVDKRANLARLYAELTSLAKSGKLFFDENGDAIVEVNALSRPTLELLARYSPEITCVLEGLVVGEKNADKTFRNGKFYASDSFARQMDGYTASDRPKYLDVGTGPTCRSLPHPTGDLPSPTSKDGADHPGPIVIPGVGVPQ